LERAVQTGLIFTVVVIKWFTGIALMPLLLLTIMVFGLAFGFSLRMQRLNSPRR
jgi:hypothetical protein